MERSFEYRIFPNAAQREQIARTFGCCRWVYNRCLQERRDARERGEAMPGRFVLDRMLPAWKAECPWLADADSHALQQAVRDLCRAYDNFFRNPGKFGLPRFKSKRAGRKSYRTNWGISVVDGGHVRLPKLGCVRARISRPIEGRVLSATVKRVPSGKYFVVLCCADCPAPVAPEPIMDVLGIDAGVRDVAVCSDGTRLTNPRHLAKGEARLRREQRRLSRKAKGSKNRERQRLKVARCHERVANQRKDVLHKFTTKAVRESQAVAVEDLNVAGMMRNHHLARALSDAAMSEMVRQLAYKCRWYGRDFVKVGRFYPSSKTCGSCGHVLAGLPLSARRWECPECGAAHDRDLNAAVNIAREGRRILKGTAGLAGTAV